MLRGKKRGVILEVCDQSSSNFGEMQGTYRIVYKRFYLPVTRLVQKIFALLCRAITVRK